MEKVCTSIHSKETLSEHRPKDWLDILFNILVIAGFFSSIVVTSSAILYSKISQEHPLPDFSDAELQQSPAEPVIPEPQHSSPSQPLPEETHPVSIPWITDRFSCERSGRIWKESEGMCWDGQHSYLF